MRFYANIFVGGIAAVSAVALRKVYLLIAANTHGFFTVSAVYLQFAAVIESNELQLEPHKCEKGRPIREKRTSQYSHY